MKIKNSLLKMTFAGACMLGFLAGTSEAADTKVHLATEAELIAATNKLTLQVAGKQDKLPYPTNAIPQGAVSELATSLDNKLNTSGGTLTGGLYFNYNTEGWGPNYVFINLYDANPQYMGSAIIGYDSYTKSFEWASIDESYNQTTVALPVDRNGVVALRSDIPTAWGWGDITNKPNLATVATSGSYNDLSDKPTIPTVPTDVSAFNNDAGYVTDTAVAAAATASTNYTDTAISQIPAPDFTSSNTTLVATIEENAPAPGNYAAVSNAAMSAAGPKSFVVSPDPSYQYSGGGSIPNGNYYKAVTGEGLALYAAKVPFPKGRIVLTGDLADDPIVEHFGGALEITDITTVVSALGGYESDGTYSVADLVCTPSALLNLAVVLHTNILNPLPEITGSTMTWTDSHLAITTSDGVQHSLYFPTKANATTYTYTDNAYDPSIGETTTSTRTLTISYASDVAMDYGVAFFGPTEFATIDQIDTARSRLMERTGRPNELGTGWGYKIYDFKSDERRWELQVPRLTPLLTGLSELRVVRGSYYSGALPDDGISYSGRICVFQGWGPTVHNAYIGLTPAVGTIVKELIATSNKYSTAGSQYADWSIGILPRKDNPETSGDCGIIFSVTNIAIGISSRPYLWGGISLDYRISVDPLRHCILDRDGHELQYSFTTNVLSESMVDDYNTIIYQGVTYTNTLPSKLFITCNNFRVASITYNQYTATINLNYDTTVVQPVIYFKNNCTFGYAEGINHTRTYGNSLQVVLHTAQNLETYTAHANRVITDYNQHMIYDPGLKCTWEIACTNGVFFTRKVSRDDYRKVEFVEEW